MPEIQRVLYYLGHGLAVVFLSRFIWNRHAARYPFFSVFLVIMSARLVFAILIDPKVTLQNQLFWATSNLIWVLSMAVAWEFHRQVIPRGHPLRHQANGVGFALLLTLALCFWWMGPEGDVFSDLERKLTLSVSAWLLLTFGWRVFYGLPASRQVWGMAVGMGIVTSLTLINFAALGLSPEFRNAWSLIRQAGFSVVMLIWLWAFWHPLAPKGPEPPISSTVLLTWRNNWERLKIAIKDLVHS